MNFSKLRRTVSISLLFATSLVAQHHNDAAAKVNLPVDLGSIEFPNSGPVEAQKSFIEGVLLLHSFEYSRSRRAFQEASRIAPNFALAYWGEAMTYDHPIWGEYDRVAAQLVLSRLGATSAERAAKAPTEREKMYLNAIELRFGEGVIKETASAYSAAMFDITKRFPDDLEAQAFYALSLLGLTGTVRNTENYMKAAAVAESVYEKNQKHPGALHYLIHAYDDPTHAPLGLRAARLYGTVARSASHAQHMPSHIFFALGMWEDSIAANAASMKTARDEGTGGYHPLHWLMHSYLQLGRNEDAAKLLAVVEEDSKTKALPSNRTYLAMCRATMLVETKGNGPATMIVPADAAGSRSIVPFANHDLAIGLEYVRKNDLTEAKRILTGLRTRTAAASVSAAAANGQSNGYASGAKGDVETIGLMEQVLAATIQFAEGGRNEALQKIVAAAEAEDKLVFEYGPPAIVKPAWEAAGEMLLAAGKKAEAADAFRNVLKRYPNRRLSNEGLRASR